MQLTSELFPILLELQLYWWNFCIAFTTLDHVHFTQIVLVFGFENMKWSPKWNHPFSFYHCLLFTSHPLLTPVTVVFGSTLEQIQKKKIELMATLLWCWRRRMPPAADEYDFKWQFFSHPHREYAQRVSHTIIHSATLHMQKQIWDKNKNGKCWCSYLSCELLEASVYCLSYTSIRNVNSISFKLLPYPGKKLKNVDNGG